ncbi:hypothetical protein GCM10010193_15840 [Kitasatospora atroaurantiaca]|uniref:Phosphopantetheine binding protein n=1 Tax=Kitasatospora atroaurantiaca TaxID=285545 RepID=A0A561EVH2_9ACTN|nr:phosphopantetheine binding protein [Kitasatospora atroaurantiaca]
MAERTPTIEKLEALPRSERVDALESLVTAEFKDALFMDEDEELPFESPFFELGLTSLRLTEIKERLETLLGGEIDTNALFNSPTVAQLLIHLTSDVLPDLFAGT